MRTGWRISGSLGHTPPRDERRALKPVFVVAKCHHQVSGVTTLHEMTRFTVRISVIPSNNTWKVYFKLFHLYLSSLQVSQLGRGKSPWCSLIQKPCERQSSHSGFIWCQMLPLFPVFGGFTATILRGLTDSLRAWKSRKKERKWWHHVA